MTQHGKRPHHRPHQRHGHGTGHKFDPARLERLRDPIRLEKQNPDRIWAVLAKQPVETLVDLGAGIGFFSIPYARKMASGTVYACDMNEDMLEYLQEAIAKEGVTNVRPVKTMEVEVPLDDGIADVVLMVNLHHELDFRDRSLTECRRLLREGGRVAVIDWKPIETEKGPPLEIRIPPDQVREELEAAGFREIVEHAILPEHYFLTGVK